jgi:hypothetical protein
MKTESKTENQKDSSEKTRPVVMSDEIASGKYANTYRISGSSTDFLIDFMFSDSEARRVVSRLILSPSKAKSLSASLSQVVAKFEADYGPIDPPVER